MVGQDLEIIFRHGSYITVKMALSLCSHCLVVSNAILNILDPRLFDVPSLRKINHNQYNVINNKILLRHCFLFANVASELSGQYYKLH